jgi:hypothetical protein
MISVNPMAARVSAVIVVVLFAWLLFIAFSNILQLAQSGRLGFGDFTLLLFCGVVCAAGIGFFLRLLWASRRPTG